jgi:hydrogenase/urease accessory protein HupE
MQNSQGGIDMIKKWIIFLIFMTLFALQVPAAQAHSGSSEAFSSITVDTDGIRYTLRVDLGELVQAAVSDGSGTSLASLEAMDTYLREHQTQVENYVFSQMKLYADGVPLDGHMVQLRATDSGNRPFAEAEITYPAKQAPELLSLSYNLIFDDVDQGHANYAVLSLNGHREEFIMTYEFREVKLGEMSLLRAAKQFLLHGMEHLFTGYDHMLFLLGLMLGARSIKQILAVVTAFTAAHSVTLILAGLHIVSLPAKFVEPVIAFSIIYVALNNLFYRKFNHNIWLAFGFGLVHGFGFAGTLSELRLDSGQLVSSLLFFNVGIEFGQVLLVLLLFPLIQYLRNVKFKWPVPAISVTISLFGLIWFIQRLFVE